MDEKSSSPRGDGSDAPGVIQIADKDAAFILGRGGATKRKLASVSGASIELNESNSTIEVRGDPVAKQRGMDYVDFVMQQRVGNVRVSEDRDDLSIVDVPQDCIGVVVGKKRATLRAIEEEYGVLMLFGVFDDNPSKEILCIFG